MVRRLEICELIGDEPEGYSDHAVVNLSWKTELLDDPLPRLLKELTALIAPPMMVTAGNSKPFCGDTEKEPAEPDAVGRCVCLIYGYREEPFEMQSAQFHNGGRSWEREITLRGNGGGRDIGHPVSVQRPDGKVVTIYYFHDQPLGDRYIAATI